MILVDRLSKLWKIIENKNINIESIFLPNFKDENFYYMTGLDGIFEGCFSVLRKKENEVFVPELEYETAKKQGIKKPNLIRTRSNVTELIKIALAGSKTVGVVANKLPYSYGKRLESMDFKLVDISGCFDECRMIKDKDEIEKIRKAVDVTKMALEEIKTIPLTETIMAAKLDGTIRSNNCNFAFPTICAADKNSALPHYSTGTSKIDQMVLVDFGARFDGYCADISRYFFRVKDDWFKKADSMIMNTYDRCLEVAEKGGSGADMQRAAQLALGENFIHSIGHFIGRDVHENSLSNFKEALRPGMTFTIEPGLYDIKHGGLRFENDFVVTKNGIKEF